MECATAETLCFHCGSPLPHEAALAVQVGGRLHAVCCGGCAAATNLIVAQHLERFYDFRSAPTRPADAAARNWCIFDRETALRRYTHQRPDGERELSLQIEGLSCSACAWLIENSLGQEPGVTHVLVNASAARAELRFDPQRVALSRVLGKIQALGYVPLPLAFSAGASAGATERRAALKRLAVAGFGMMQVMTFSVSLYAGVMQGMAPELKQFLRFVSLIVATPVVLYAAQPFFVSAWHSLRARSPGMDVPVALSIGAAYVWSVTSTLRGHGAVYYDSVVMFTFFLLLGRFVEMSLRHRQGMQHDAIARLLPESALRLEGARAERVTPDELHSGDRVRVLPGERVPADGRIETGSSELDESLLTGESAPRLRNRGDALIAGSLNLSGVVEMSVTRIGQDSTLAEVSRLLERAHASRPEVADLADRVAAWFVGGVLFLAAGVAVYWWQVDPARAFPTVLAVLVVTCPCALSLATPAALAAATTALARAGLLVTRGRALERLAGADRILFDKTGTLTRGEPRLAETRVLSTRLSANRCLEVAAALESCSGHPLARAFTSFVPASGVSDVRTAPGRGVEGMVDGVRYRIGRAEYVLEGCAAGSPLAPAATEQGHTSIVLGDRIGILAAFRVTDLLRSDARETLKQIQSLGITPQIVSGDHRGAVAAAARQLGDIFADAGMTASAKLSLVQSLQSQGQRVVMVGDGVNDAPVLAAADVSVAIASGTDLAKVNADVILLGQRLSGLVYGVESSRRMLRIIRQNLAWAVLYNVTAVPLAASGWIEPWMAALGMSASSLLVVLNAARLLKVCPRSAAPEHQPVERAIHA